MPNHETVNKLLAPYRSDVSDLNADEAKFVTGVFQLVTVNADSYRLAVLIHIAARLTAHVVVRAMQSGLSAVKVGGTISDLAFYHYLGKGHE